MNRGARWPLRCLSLVHFGCGAILLLAAGWYMISMLRVIPHLSTGTAITNIAGVLFFATAGMMPLAALGVWLIMLGRGLWSGRAWLRSALLWTHGGLLALGSLAVAVGIHAMRAAERSAAQGGGLLGPVAVIPLIFGVPVALLALPSIAVAILAVNRTQAGSQDRSA